MPNLKSIWKLWKSVLWLWWLVISSGKNKCIGYEITCTGSDVTWHTWNMIHDTHTGTQTESFSQMETCCHYPPHHGNIWCISNCYDFQTHKNDITYQTEPDLCYTIRFISMVCCNIPECIHDVPVYAMLLKMHWGNFIKETTIGPIWKTV